MSDETVIDFSYAEDADAFFSSAVEFARREVEPQIDNWRRDASSPREVFVRAGETGLLGLLSPPDIGGIGLSDWRFCQLSTRALVETAAFGLAWSIGLHAAVAIPALVRYGGEHLTEVLSSATSGVKIATIAGLACDVTLGQDGELSGVARGVPTAVLADEFVVLARDPDGIDRAVVIPRSAATVIESSRGLGAAEAGVRDVDFSGARVAQSRILPPEAAEFIVAAAAQLIAGISVAAARFSLDETSRYVNERVVFGRPVAGFDNTRTMISGVHAEVVAAESFLDRVWSTSMNSAGGLAQTAALGRVCVAAFGKSADTGLQLHGGYGYMAEYPISHAFAAARYFQLAFDQLPYLSDRLAVAAGLTPGRTT